MGFKKEWDVNSISLQILRLSRECNSPYNDGFVAWGCKQDLYVIKEIIDSALQTAPNFGDLEHQWLKEQEQKRIIKILKE